MLNSMDDFGEDSRMPGLKFRRSVWRIFLDGIHCGMLRIKWESEKHPTTFLACGFYLFNKSQANKPMGPHHTRVRFFGSMNSTFPRTRGRTQSRNRQWTANSDSTVFGQSGRGGRGAARGRKYPNPTLRNDHHDQGTKQVAVQQQQQTASDRELEELFGELNEPELESQEEREKFYQEVCFVCL